MSINKTGMKQAGSTTELLEEGGYPSRLVQIIDLGLQKRKAYAGKEKPDAYQFWLTYELPTEFMKNEDGEDILDKPRWVSESINVFSRSQDQATSTKRLDILDPANEFGDDWAKALGQPSILSVVHSKDGKYANVGTISAPMKGMEVPPLVNAPVLFDMDDPDMEVYEKLPDFLKEWMGRAVDFSESALARELGVKATSTDGEAQPNEGEEDGAPY